MVSPGLAVRVVVLDTGEDFAPFLFHKLLIIHIGATALYTHLLASSQVVTQNLFPLLSSTQ